MSQPYAKNMSVEFAEKAIPGGELQKSIDNSLNAVTIPVLTEDTALEIFEKKPKFVVYNDYVYILQDFLGDSAAIYYTSSFSNGSYTLSIESDGTIEAHSIELAKTEDIKPLYFHPISIISPQDALDENKYNCSFILINNTPNPIDTFNKLIDAFNAIYNALEEGITIARIPSTGFLKSSSSQTILASTIELVGTGLSNFRLYGLNLSTGNYDYMVLNTMLGNPRVFDGVNRIN